MMLNLKTTFDPRRLVLLLPFLALILFGCSEQPLGYIYRPIQRDAVSLARVTEDISSSLFDHVDLVVSLLEDASHTQNYKSIFPGEWRDTTIVDPLTGNTMQIFSRNYLDQTIQQLAFDLEPMPGAVRQPSDVGYSFFDFRNFLNGVTNEYYTDIYESLRLMIEYADERLDPHNVTGWFTIKRAVAFEEEIDLGEFGSYSYTYWMYPEWVIYIDYFSVDELDHSARLVIEGTFPHDDEAGDFRDDHVSGEIIVKADGQGYGEINLFGEPAARIYFTGRGAGFEGYFTLHSQNHSERHEFE